MPDRRRILLIAVTLLAAPCVLTGCLDARDEIRIDPTGRGAYSQVTSVSVAGRDDLVRRLATLFGAETPPDALPFADPFHPRWVRERAREVKGVTLERVQRTAPTGRLVTSFSASFDSLESAARADLFFPAEVRLERLVQPGDAPPRWRLTFTDPWADAATREDGTLGGKPFAEVLTAVGDALSTFTRHWVIDLPTPAVESNGTLDPSRRRVSWRCGPAELEARRCLRRVVVLEGAEELDLAPFRHRPDPRTLMNRALEAPPGGP